MSSDFNSDASFPQPFPLKVEPRPLSERDRAAAETLLASTRVIRSVFADPLLKAGLEERGYDAREIQTGLTLQAAAEEEFVSCQTLLGSLDAATAAFEEAWVGAREEYVEFRGAVRALYDQAICARSFKVYGIVAPQLPEFVVQAVASYSAVLENGLGEALVNRGFDAFRMCGDVAELRTLLELDAAVRNTRAALASRLDRRDVAIGMFNLWIRDLLQNARLVTGVTYRPPSGAESWSQPLVATGGCGSGRCARSEGPSPRRDPP